MPLNEIQVTILRDRNRALSVLSAIEATVIEVRTKGDLRFGLQWFFSGSSGDYAGNASLAEDSLINVLSLRRASSSMPWT